MEPRTAKARNGGSMQECPGSMQECPMKKCPSSMQECPRSTGACRSVPGAAGVSQEHAGVSQEHQFCRPGQENREGWNRGRRRPRMARACRSVPGERALHIRRHKRVRALPNAPQRALLDAYWGSLEECGLCPIALSLHFVVFNVCYGFLL
jgi:hypothetical protein